MRQKQIESRKQSCSPSKCYKDKGSAQESNLDVNFLNYQFAKYRTTKYIKIIPPHDDISGPKLQLEVEGRWINSRGKSKDITYFECASHRHVNAPDCGFRARIKNFDSSANEGDIYILSEHSSTCKYTVGNDVKEFSNNPNLSQNKFVYKSMKIEIEKKTRRTKLAHSWRSVDLD